MSERIVNDPSQHGWVEEDGKWVWDGQSAGSIEDGDTEGQVTTWSGEAWTPESGLTIDATGNATFSGDIGVGGPPTTSPSYHRLHLHSVGTYGSQVFMQNPYGDWGISCFGANAGQDELTFYSWDYGDNVLRLSSDGNAAFSGTVDAAGFTVNGQPIGGGGGDNTFTTIETTRGTNGYFFKASYGEGGDATTFGHNNGGASLGITPIGGKIKVNGTIEATDLTATSDERLKDNITTVPVGLIDSLKGREWDWSESGEKGSGVIAQELEQVLPHLVHEDDEGMKSVSYMGLLAYVIEELKNCRQRLAVLEGKE